MVVRRAPFLLTLSLLFFMLLTLAGFVSMFGCPMPNPPPAVQAERDRFYRDIFWGWINSGIGIVVSFGFVVAQKPTK